MDTVRDSILDFIRARQLNIAVAGLLTLIYLLYQYWSRINKERGIEAEPACNHRVRLSRSRSRSGASRSDSRTRVGHNESDDKHGRRRRKRCPDCSLCNSQK